MCFALVLTDLHNENFVIKVRLDEINPYNHDDHTKSRHLVSLSSLWIIFVVLFRLYTLLPPYICNADLIRIIDPFAPSLSFFLRIAKVAPLLELNSPTSITTTHLLHWIHHAIWHVYTNDYYITYVKKNNNNKNQRRSNRTIQKSISLSFGLIWEKNKCCWICCWYSTWFFLRAWCMSYGTAVLLYICRELRFCETKLNHIHYHEWRLFG